jgi:serine/threonine-protein kinase
MERLGRYQILGELGRGAMGVVYKAADPMLNRTVAIKTINMTADPEERADYEKRFYQEARAAGGLSHPNIVTIYDIGHAGDAVYMAMEFIEGEELRTLLAGERLAADTALDIAAQVAEGLGYAHSRGIIHRDIKPANIMVARNGPAKIMDFGIARMRQSDVKTQTGFMLGSPKYMAPEQLLGKAIDHRCDLFALGVLIYEMTVGAPPFAGADITQLMYQIVHAAPPAPTAVNPRLPPMLDLVVARALAKDPEGRYPDARALAADLRACRAQLASAPAPAARDADEDDTDTLVLQPAAAADVEETQTLPLQAVRTDAGPRLRISHRFDSAEATRRLATLTGSAQAVDAFAKTMRLDRAGVTAPGGATEPAADTTRGRAGPAATGRRSARGTLLVLAGVIIALVVAVVIALT